MKKVDNNQLRIVDAGKFVWGDNGVYGFNGDSDNNFTCCLAFNSYMKGLAFYIPKVFSLAIGFFNGKFGLIKGAGCWAGVLF